MTTRLTLSDRDLAAWFQSPTKQLWIQVAIELSVSNQGSVELVSCEDGSTLLTVEVRR